MVPPTETLRLALRHYPQDRSAWIQQQWHHLLFLHWEYDPILLQHTLPPGLTVDLYEGKAYVGIVPFWMNNVKLKYLPAIPGTSNFFELNLRTYVFDEKGTPGVWFYSLDANNLLAVKIAQLFFKLPYRYSQIQSSINTKNQIEYRCQTNLSSIPLEFIYQGQDPFYNAEPGSLEFFLIERYILFTSSGKKLLKGQVHHAPYRLCKPQLSSWNDQLFAIDGLQRPQRPPDHMLFSPGVDVEIFSLLNCKD